MARGEREEINALLLGEEQRERDKRGGSKLEEEEREREGRA